MRQLWVKIFNDASDRICCWIKEEEEFFKTKAHPITDTWTDNDNLWKDLPKLLPYLEEIYFAGGEPLVQEGHYKLLHFLIDNKKTDLTEYYNFMYQYKNDCLAASVEYNKNYYDDRDIKPEESIFFKLTIMPFGQIASTPDLIE